MTNGSSKDETVSSPSRVRAQRDATEASAPLRDLVATWARTQPGKAAFIDSDTVVTYAQMAERIDDMRAALLEAGVRPGDRIVAAVPNGVEFAILFFAAMQIGANAIPLNTLLVSAEVEKRLRATRPRIVFAHLPEHAAEARRLGYRAISLNAACGCSEVLGMLASHVASEPAPAPFAVRETRGNRPSLTIFTSGTTGDPKGVLLSENGLAHAVRSINEALCCKSDDVFFSALPVSHLFGVNASVLLPMLVGGTSVVMPRFKAEAALDSIERNRVSVFNGVPAMFKRMAVAQEERPRDLSAMRTGCMAGAKCSNLEEYRRVLHCSARVVYGLTESPIIATTCPGDTLDTEISGVGRFISSVEAHIVDGLGQILATGTVGEIVCKSPGTMVGYCDNEKATKERIDERGWLHTGDMAYVDGDGYVHVVGRKSDVINRGGYKVFPAGIEAVYADHPGVLDCCAMGFPHEELGEQIVLFVELKPCCDARPGELRDYAKERIAKYKIPDQVIVLDRMPRLPNEKPDKQALNRLYDERGEVLRDNAELCRRMDERR